MRLSRKDMPLYLQIKNIVRDRILHGVYPIGMNIPSEPQLESEFGVSKITVRNAIKELAQEGYVEPSSGKGTKVIRNTSASKLSKWKRFTELLVEEGCQIQKQLVCAQSVINKEGTVPYQLFGDSCFYVERLYLLNGKPFIHFTHYLTDRMEQLEQSDLDMQSLYGVLEEQDITFGSLRDEFAVAVAPAQVSVQLGLSEGTPLLKKTRYSYDESNEAIEYSIGYYNTEMHQYIVKYDV